MKIGVIGINHRLADLKLREQFGKVCGRHFGQVCNFHGHHSFLLLSTCNRTEIYFSSDDLSQTHTYLLALLGSQINEDFSQKLYSFFDKDCLLHLFRVTSGLDSAVLGETEIQGQVKNAYQKSCTYNQYPSDIHYLFQKALRVGKLVRTSFSFHQTISSLEHSVFKLASGFIDKPLLFVGASSTNRKIIQYFKAKGQKNISLCNRTDSKAESVADLEGVAYIPWSKRLELEDFQCIILGTKSSEPLIRASDLNQIKKETLIIDLSVPRNVEPSAAMLPLVTLANIDHVNKVQNKRQKRLSEVTAKAEKAVSDAAHKYRTLFYKKQRVGKTQEIYAAIN